MTNVRRQAILGIVRKLNLIWTK